MVPFKIVKGHRPRPATADCLVAFVIPHLDKGFQSAFLESNAIQESYPAFATQQLLLRNNELWWFGSSNPAFLPFTAAAIGSPRMIEVRKSSSSGLVKLDCAFLVSRCNTW